ncbi:hypothetical protein D3C72_849220 [compost metagenome]
MGADHDLHRRPAATLGGLHQPLGDEGLEVVAKIVEQLGPALLGEEVDDAVQRLVGVVGVQGGDGQMPGLREGQRMLHGLPVTDLTDEDDVRCLAQGVLQGRVEAAGVHPHLPLVDDALAVAMDELHRILDGDDVATAVAVAMVDEGRERGGLARAGAADEEHQAALLHDGVEQHRGKLQVLEAGDLCLDVARHQGDLVALLEDVDPKAAYLGQGDGEVHLQLLLELLLLLRVHEIGGDPGHLARLERHLVQGAQGAIELGAGGGPGGEIEVGAILLGQDL